MKQLRKDGPGGKGAKVKWIKKERTRSRKKGVWKKIAIGPGDEVEKSAYGKRNGDK